MAEGIVAEVEYRDIPGFPGYRVGSDGSVLSLWRRIGRQAGRRLGTEWRSVSQTSTVRADGYVYVTVSLRNAAGRTNTKVSRLVLLVFVGPCPEGMECCHNNGNSRDNRRQNLRWDTPLENAHDRIRHGTAANLHGERNGRAKLTESEVIRAKEMYASGMSFTEIAEHVQVHRTHVSRIIRGERWKSLA